jgi:CubicO group peptidase (beta-lactamase class C family)
MLLDSLVVVSLLVSSTYAYCPPPGALLPPPTLGPANSAFSSPPNFSIPDSVFKSIPIQNVSYAVKGSIGDNTIFQYEYSAPGREVPQSLFKTKIRVGSVTKMLTALALEMSSDKITLEDPITKFIPGLSKQYYQDVTIGALASHTSGLGRYVCCNPWPSTNIRTDQR